MMLLKDHIKVIKVYKKIILSLIIHSIYYFLKNKEFYLIIQIR